MPGAWTPAHSEAAVFLGECVAVGAVLGFLAELARVVGEDDVWGGPGSLRALTRSGRCTPGATRRQPVDGEGASCNT